MDRITHRATSLVIKGVLFANDFEGWVIALLVIIPVYFLPKLVKKKIRTFIFVQPLGSGKTSLVGKVKKKIVPHRWHCCLSCLVKIGF